MLGPKFTSKLFWRDQLLCRLRETVSFESEPFQQKPIMEHMEYSTGSQQPSRERSLANLTGWRKAVAYGCMCVVLALICNIALLIWAHTKPKSTSNTFVLYDGDCENIRSISTWSHLGINIVATLVLSGSNYAMQVLIAPTREDADAAHEKQRSVAIGVLSFTNWKYMGRHKQVLYLGLLLTSIPFHIIFNSVIFDTTSAVDFGMYLVTGDFLDLEPAPNSSATSTENSTYSIWKSASQHQWTNLTKEDCYSTFFASYVHNYGNVILFTNASSVAYGESCLASISYRDISQEWFCNHVPDCQPSLNLAKNWTINDAFVQHCIAEPAQQSCKVQLSPQLLGVVIACNAIKVLILILLLCSTFIPLVTIGDAIASYIDEPDPATNGWGAISAAELRKNPSLRTIYASPHNSLENAIEVHRTCKKQPWRNEKLKYVSDVTPLRWNWALLSCFSYLMFGFGIMLLTMNNSESLQSIWQGGLGSTAPSRVASWRVGFLNTVIIANMPQLLLSVTYLLYNSVFTSMLLSQEWTNYAHQRKSLRVTNLEGDQRSTYFLSLPYRFSIPLLIASAFLHWSLSQSLFFVQVDFTYYNGLPDPSDSILTVGFSIIGLLILSPVGVIMIITLVLFGL